MAITDRGQLNATDIPGTGTLTDTYTVPASMVSDVNITVSNRADTDTALRIAHIKNGVAAGVANEDYLIFDLQTALLASNFAPISITGVMMSAGDTIAVYSSVSALSVQINGIQEDV